eukprot:s1385_g38.t1
MASGGKGIYAAQAASSSSSGGDPTQGWSAADSLQQIAANRARQWHESEGLTLDNDFAFAFVDYDHFVGAAGHHVADAWLQVRSKVEEDLLHQGAQAIEGPKQPMPFKPVRKHTLKRKPQTKPPTPAGLSEADQRRVTGLALKAEWKQTCTRIVQKKVKDAEKATLDRVVNTSCTSTPSSEVDQQERTSIWPRVTGPKGQAPVAEPPLIQALENRIEELYSVGDERWSVLLGCWMMCFGCLRYTHITRSEPRKLTPAFLHCQCLRGKQQKNRDGFDFGARWSSMPTVPWHPLVKGPPGCASQMRGARALSAPHLWPDGLALLQCKVCYFLESQGPDQDRQPVWASTNTFHDVHKRIKLSQKFVKKAEDERQAAAATSSPQMPSSLNGKGLTATLKNGRALCPDFQTDECANDPDSCPFGAHLCAALQQSGRACGGKHGAAICHSKRVVKDTTPVPSAPLPTATKVPAATGGAIAFSRKRQSETDPTPKVKRAKSSAQPKEASARPMVKAATAKAASVKPAAKAAVAKAATGQTSSPACSADLLLPSRADPQRDSPAWRSDDGVRSRLRPAMGGTVASDQEHPVEWDDVLVHCIKGRHRHAYLGVLLRALLANESIDGAN